MMSAVNSIFVVISLLNQLMSAVNSVFVVISLLNQLMSAVNSVFVVISCIESFNIYHSKNGSNVFRCPLEFHKKKVN
jgi:ABC-type multidrug transport system fused ATPase/permease subunit